MHTLHAHNHLNQYSLYVATALAAWNDKKIILLAMVILCDMRIGCHSILLPIREYLYNQLTLFFFSDTSSTLTVMISATM